MKAWSPLGRLSLRFKTVLGIALIEIVLLAVLVWLSLDYLASTKADAIAERARSTVDLFAILAKDAVLSDDLASLDTFADAVMRNPDVAYLRVTGHGRRLVTRGEAAVADAAADGRQGVAVAGGVLHARAEIREAGTGFGLIEIGLSTAAQVQLVDQARRRLLGIALLEIALVALFSLLLGSYLTRSLCMLKRAAQELAATGVVDGGLSHRIPVEGRDELADTARAFNQMAERLQRSYDALEEARAGAERAAAEAQAASAAADAANAAKSRFLAHMSHELRTPLNAVLGTLDMTRDWVLSTEQREHLVMANEAGHALLELINNVLDLSKIEAGEMTLFAEPTALAELVERAAATVRPLARAKGLDLRIALAADLPAAVQVDPLRLRQVLINLLGNAVKFTDSGQVSLGVQTLCTGASCERLRFEVQDTGTGIPKDRQARLFDEFSQIHDGAVKQSGGTGLGLAISQRIVNLMGGQIAIDSAPGQGSRFSFELTLAVAQRAVVPVVAAKPVSACHLPAGMTRRDLPILLVDDVKTNRMVAAAALTKAGYVVRTADNGVEALAAVCREPLGSVLMDVSMPVMDGLEATRRIRSLAGSVRALPIIAMTAHALTEEEDRCRAAGMDDFITKPFARERLLTVVDFWHGSRHLRTTELDVS
ncbi:ATP-binding protein [uncultured Lamprocystis sp.]|jgi:signal transduction histidine kinase/AmiR/NasT family two-component response regulator|uniref:ATP-binding protein n=1 Tax=uncultured Lamprocystis sp. TaxID=543132 RepID=UPI0025E8313F|nr:ATP-binding protein [uncultured Lamprocystis sp.]